jgi:phenylacetate-coenzyme A ligase PaaK-like adenylate-forming protein
MWRHLDPGPAVTPLERLAALPWVTKAMLRRHGVEDFVPQGRCMDAALAAGEIELAQTSGSTGDRVTNVWYQPWWDASERASWALNTRLRDVGLGGHREAILTSPLCTGVVCEEGYLDESERTLGRFLYLNERWDPTTWTPAHMDRMLRELAAFRPAVLEANPSFLARLCAHALDRGLRPPRLHAIVFTYENPSLLHYRLAEEVFRVRPTSSYGTTEAGCVFMECEAGHLHQNTAACHVDFVPFRSEHGGPALGRILVTTFGNPWRSLLRFDPGDVVRLAHGCPCGRSEGLVLAGLEGRLANLTTTPEGRAVTQAAVDRVVAPIPGLREYQLNQHTCAAYELRYVSDNGRITDRRIADRAKDGLKALYGPAATVTAIRVAAIQPDPPGKYRLTKSRLGVDEDLLIAPAHRPSPC